jgi:kinetochore protein Nuf2
MGGQYWFPSMTIPEIMNALSDWQLSASHEQLVRPSPDFVTAIYFACLDQVTDLNHHSLHDPAHDALNSLEDPNPDLYAAPLSHSILLHHM